MALDKFEECQAGWVRWVTDFIGYWSVQSSDSPTAFDSKIFQATRRATTTHRSRTCHAAIRGLRPALRSNVNTELYGIRPKTTQQHPTTLLKCRRPICFVQKPRINCSCALHLPCAKIKWYVRLPLRTCRSQNRILTFHLEFYLT